LKRLTISGSSPARLLRRCRVLLLLDKGWRDCDIPEATGASSSTVGRIKRRYRESGLDAAINEMPRPGPTRRITKRDEVRIVAMVCAAPPTGRARWTVRLAAEEAVARGLVDSIGRERVRELLAEHDLKPWRKKNVVRSRTDG
jgi:transposase